MADDDPQCSPAAPNGGPSSWDLSSVSQMAFVPASSPATAAAASQSPMSHAVAKTPPWSLETMRQISKYGGGKSSGVLRGAINCSFYAHPSSVGGAEGLSRQASPVPLGRLLGSVWRPSGTRSCGPAVGDALSFWTFKIFRPCKIRISIFRLPQTSHSFGLFGLALNTPSDKVLSLFGFFHTSHFLHSFLVSS